MGQTFYSLAGAIAALAIGAAAATPASAAMTLAVGEEDCDLYSAAGCLFNYANGDGNVFDDPTAFENAWNGTHLANPAPQTLELGDLTAKFDFGGVNVSEAIAADFAVSFYAVKTGSGQVVLYGLNPAKDSFTAFNSRITNKKGQVQAISHVTVFGVTSPNSGGVPEPATWAMMILGFGGIGAAMRQRRGQLARVAA